MIVNIDNFFDVYEFSPHDCVIKLNGVEEKHVVSFDIGEGWAERYIVSPNGEYKLLPSGEGFDIERLHGKIEVLNRNEM